MMANMRVWLFVLLVACGGGKSREAAVCERGNDICDDDVKVAACADQLRDLKKMVGGDTYSKLLRCGTAAKSCPEFVGCFVGSFAGMGREFERGFNRTAGGSDSEPDSDRVRPEPDHRNESDADHRSGTDIDHRSDTDIDHRSDTNHRTETWSSHTESHTTTGDPTTTPPDPAPQPTLTCAKFEGQPHDAKWTDCTDKARREVVCEPFVDELTCACVVDGVEKWHFSARDPQLQDKDEATRVARANCQMGFDGF
jgi:hypothetical protein